MFTFSQPPLVTSTSPFRTSALCSQKVLPEVIGTVSVCPPRSSVATLWPDWIIPPLIATVHFESASRSRFAICALPSPVSTAVFFSSPPASMNLYPVMSYLPFSSSTAFVPSLTASLSSLVFISPSGLSPLYALVTVPHCTSMPPV